MYPSTIKKFQLTNSMAFPALNTRTLLDFSSGFYQLGVGLRHHLNGGITPMTSFVGRAGTFKSTSVDSIIGCLLRIYPHIEVIKYDTENNAFGITRLAQVSGLPENIITEKCVLIRRCDMGSVAFSSLIKDICHERETNSKEYMVETPFFKENGHDVFSMYIPLIVDVDSFSGLQADAVEEAIIENGFDNKKNNTSDLNNGKFKTKFIEQAANLGHKFGIYFIFTAQVDDKYNLDPYAPNNKQLQHMAISDQIKRVGSQFEYLTNTMFQILKPDVLVDANKECMYPTSESTANTELSQANFRTLRCKTNVTGIDVPLVMSQNFGILPDLSNFHYLKKLKFGLSSNPRSPNSFFHPDESLSRENVRIALDTKYELARGIELLAQYKFITTNWTKSPFDNETPMTASKFVEYVTTKSTYLASDILNSRGYWTYDTAETRPYMSLVDIVNSIEDNTPKVIATTQVSASIASSDTSAPIPANDTASKVKALFKKGTKK